MAYLDVLKAEKQELIRDLNNHLGEHQQYQLRMLLIATESIGRIELVTEQRDQWYEDHFKSKE